MIIDDFANLIVTSLSGKKNKDFTGFGVVIINEDFRELPISSLLYEFDSYLAIESLESLNSFLFETSKSSDHRHDGFHIYNTEKKILAISQYFSPPIKKELNSIIYNVGARVRTAQYGSLCKGVLAIITVSNSGEVYLVVNGQAHRIKNQ